MAQGQHHGVIHAQSPAHTVCHTPQVAAREKLAKVMPVRGNEYPTYLNQSPSQNFKGLILLVLQT